MFGLDFPGGQRAMFIFRSEEYAKKTVNAFWTISREIVDIGGNKGLRLSESLARLRMTFVGLETSLARCI